MDMYLSMLTADAAAKHGHEFSRAATMPVGQQMLPPRRLPIPRSPLSVLPRTKSPHTPNVSRSRQRPQSMKITMAELKEVPGEDEQADEEEELRKIDAKIRSFTIPGAFHESPNSSPSRSEDRSLTPTPRSAPILPIVKTTPDSTPRATPSASQTADAANIRRNTQRPKTFYRLGHSPRAEKRGILRPRVLLQIQEPRGPRFHRPVFDVVPGSRFNPRTKIGQKLRRLRRNKDGTGADDLVVVRSEHLEGREGKDTKEEPIEEEHEKEQDHDHETLNGQEVLGTIQPAEDGPSAYITIGEAVWCATLDGRGASYTLESLNNPLERVRWYVPKAKRTGDLSGGPREFSLATLLPGTKRHPIIANMSQGHLEFYDEYCTPMAPSEIIYTDEAMRKLIIVSGMWVFFCEGWSKHFDFNSAVASCTKPVLGRSLSMRSPSGGFRGILRSPSRSPAPSVGGDNYFSASSDTRSREGSHDSTATSISPVGTILRHPTFHTFPLQSSQPGSRTSSPQPQSVERGRRRWSLSNHLHRFSLSIRHPKEPVQQEDTLVRADVVHVEKLQSPADIEQHPLQEAFIPEAKVVFQATEAAVVDDEPPSEVQPLTLAPAVLVEEVHVERVESPVQIAEPPRLEIKPRPAPIHVDKTESPSSSDESDGGNAWWQDYNRFMLKQQNPIIIPTS